MSDTTSTTGSGEGGTPAKKASAKRSPVKKTTAKKTTSGSTAKQAPARTATTKKATTKKAAAKVAPAAKRTAPKRTGATGDDKLNRLTVVDVPPAGAEPHRRTPVEIATAAGAQAVETAVAAQRVAQQTAERVAHEVATRITEEVRKVASGAQSVAAHALPKGRRKRTK